MGEIAALATALCWMFTSIFFTIGGREVGSVVVNRIRLVMAVFFLTATHLVLEGTLLPLSVEPERWLWLGLSGIIGLVVGDAFLFQAFVLVGARLSMLIMSLVPVLSTLLAWLFLGERLNLTEIGAVGLTVGGIAWVVLERRNENTQADMRQYTLGILFGLGGAIGQAIGLITAKKGLEGDFSTLSGVLIRILVAMVVIWAIAAIQGRVRSSVLALRNQRAFLAITGGSLAGPFLGVWLSLIAIDLARVGIASTLMALAPVFILPVAHWWLKERMTWRAAGGTIVAMIGVTLIFLE
jgi:drug/metabolite transporter (DMT)-like permease